MSTTKSAQAVYEMNLNVLRRQDPAVKHIIDTAGHVVLYEFDRETGGWKNRGIEGSLFVVEREIGANSGVFPHYAFFLMNRLSPDNFLQYLSSELEFQLTDSYVIYRGAKGDIHGLWFYSSEDRVRIGERLVKLSAEPRGAIPRTEPVSPAQSAHTSSSGQSSAVNLMALFDRARRRSNDPELNKATDSVQSLKSNQQQPGHSAPLTPVKPQSASPVVRPTGGSALRDRPTASVQQPSPSAAQPSRDGFAPSVSEAFRVALAQRAITVPQAIADDSCMVSILSKESFKDVLLRTIQQDPKFVDGLYDVYRRQQSQQMPRFAS